MQCVVAYNLQGAVDRAITHLLTTVVLTIRIYCTCHAAANWLLALMDGHDNRRHVRFLSCLSCGRLAGVVGGPPIYQACSYKFQS